jgi:uncharacterized membrane protein YqjE
MMPSASSSEPGNVELLRRATRDARDLIQLEIDLAKNELRQELAAAKSSAILGAVAVVFGLTGLASLACILGLALGPLGALAIASLLLVSGAISGFLAYVWFPKKVMEATGIRLKDDETLLRERLS